MVRFDFYLPKEMLEKLKKKELETGNSVSSYIRQFVNEGLGKGNANAKDRSTANNISSHQR